MNANLIRSFVAVTIPPSVRQSLAGFTEEIQPLLPPMKWVDPVNYHVTLRFLGDLSYQEIRRTKRALESLAGEPAFAAELNLLGGFPLRGRLRVLWAGFREAEGFYRLGALTEAVLSQAGVARGKDGFHPHVTLARARQTLSRQQLKAADARRPTSWGTVPVEEVHLYASRLTPDGPEYELLHQVRLGGVQLIP